MLGTNFTEAVLKALLGHSSYASLCPTCYIGLFTSSSSTDEPDPSTGYGRAYIGTHTDSSHNCMTITGNQAVNTGIIFFPESTGNWGTITHFGVFNAETGGTPFLTGALTTSVSVPSGYVPIFRANALTITMT